MNLDVAVYTGNMEDGLKVAKDISLQGVDLIISRGITAELIRKGVDVPVVDINVSAFDVYQSMLPHLKEKKRIGVVGHEDIIRKSKYINSSLQLNVSFFAIANLNNIDEIIVATKANDIEVIIGDTTACESAMQHGLRSSLVNSGIDSVINALQYAVATHDYLVQKATSASKLQAVLDTMDCGALVASPSGAILHYNMTAKKTFSEHTLLNAPTMNSFFPKTDWASVANGSRKFVQDIVFVQNSRFSILIQPHGHENKVEYITCTFHDAKRVKNLENSFRRSEAKKALSAKHNFGSILHKSPAMGESVKKAQKYCKTESNILLVGETGTGKELFAQSIHNSSSRAKNNFVAINCGALSEDLLESELFGYEEGAFTGALKGGKTGVFELAHNGTLFLDEINATSQKLQTRLLRTLQEREIRRVGSNVVLPVNVRVIAASNTPLDEEVYNGSFRMDLFFRLSVLDITIPPLRQRSDDIYNLFNFFLGEHCSRHSIPVPAVSANTKKSLLAYPWPGNVRELRNFAEKYAILYPEVITPGTPQSWITKSLQPDLQGTLEEITASILQKVLEEESGNISRAARRMGISRNTFRKKL
ncbi:sigma 54-interacting transcriptional regulator [Halodesulfovibrio marinisediminis]|nr:sigma 54-interacting transcriptional regulator [Halodesulfovibrio marinisediminis]